MQGCETAAGRRRSKFFARSPDFENSRSVCKTRRYCIKANSSPFDNHSSVFESRSSD